MWASFAKNFNIMYIQMHYRIVFTLVCWSCVRLVAAKGSR